MDDKNISFLSCIDDKMATLSAQERGLQAQNTYKRRQISLLGVRKPVFFVEVRPFEATSEYTGCIPWNSYVSDSYDSFAWFLPCWGRGLQGCWKRGGYPWFCGSNGCRRAYFGLSMESNAPTKLSIYFGQSSLPLFFLSWNRAGEGIYLIC